MSAYELDEQQLKEINNDDHMKKPVHMAKLIETVREQLNQTLYQK